MADFIGSAIAFDQISQDAVTAAGLSTLSVGGVPGSRIIVSVDDNNIRYRYDGTAPTTTVGHRIYAGGALALEGQENLAQFKMIAETGTAVVNITLEAL